MLDRLLLKFTVQKRQTGAVLFCSTSVAVYDMFILSCDEETVAIVATEEQDNTISVTTLKNLKNIATKFLWVFLIELQ